MAKDSLHLLTAVFGPGSGQGDISRKCEHFVPEVATKRCRLGFAVGHLSGAPFFAALPLDKPVDVSSPEKKYQQSNKRCFILVQLQISGLVVGPRWEG